MRFALTEIATGGQLELPTVTIAISDGPRTT